jgi:hypothetical protein
VTGYAKAYKDRYKEDVSTFGGHAYDGLMIAVDAIKRAGGTDKAKVRDAIEATKGYIGTGGVVNMSATDHMGLDLSAFRMLESEGRRLETAEQFSAQRALMMGLVSETHSVERLDEGIAVISNALLAGGPYAQAAAKDLISVVSRQPIDTELMEETAQRIARQRATPEAKDGIAAFLEKRPPAWSS